MAQTTGVSEVSPLLIIITEQANSVYMYVCISVPLHFRNVDYYICNAHARLLRFTQSRTMRLHDRQGQTFGVGYMYD